MNYTALIRQCTEYIRQHPSSEISASGLADICGYSLYHLSSLFRACCGCSVGRYILEERLRFAAEEILKGRRILDVAADAGFDTGSGFTRAFRKQFGCSPREYRKADGKSTLTLGQKTKGKSADVFRPQPEFVKRTGLTVYGYMIPVDESHEQAGQGAFWSQVNFRELPPYPESASDYAEIGVWMNPDLKTGNMDYFFGYVTSDPSPAEGFTALALGEGDYAVFRTAYPDGIEDRLPALVQALWHYIFEDWLSGRDSVGFDDKRLGFEKYGADTIEIWVPVYYFNSST